MKMVGAEIAVIVSVQFPTIVFIARHVVAIVLSA
jgi:hypothetical protein